MFDFSYYFSLCIDLRVAFIYDLFVLVFSVVLSFAGLCGGLRIRCVKHCGVTFLFVCFSAAFRLGLDYCVFASVDGSLVYGLCVFL